MANNVSLSVYIKTAVSAIDTSKYIITFEIINPVGIQKEVFVVRRIDNVLSTAEYSRVASITDLKNLGVSGITKDSEYLVGKFSLTTSSLGYIKELKEGVPVVIQSLLDETRKGLIDVIGVEQQVDLVGVVNE